VADNGWVRRFCRLAFMFASLALIGPAAAAADPAPGEVGLIVVRDAGLTAAERADVRTDAGVELDRLMRVPNAEVVTVDRADAGAALRELNADPDVRYAVRDMKVSASTADPGWANQWGLHNLGWGGGVVDADMDVPEAWTSATGTGVKVAVADTGIDFAHADLAGQIDTVNDKDWIEDDTTANDEDGHGTHVAGTIAAISDNNVGVTGVAPAATILPLRVLDENGDGTFSDIADAFDYAGDLGVDVVNASLGGEGYGSYFNLLDSVIAAHPNTVYVVAAGNEGMDLGSVDGTSTPYWSFPCESGTGGADGNLICVGASTTSEGRASFSNYGDEEVDVFAPGSQIYATQLGGGDVYLSGTSMATPMVAGVAALLVDVDPTLTGAHLKQLLMTGDAKPAYTSVSVTGKRANASLAISSIGADLDGDGVTGGSDNCPAVANPAQTDSDNDGVGDACDSTPNGSDTDGDGVGAGDNCPSAYNPGQGDYDVDGIGDVCDATPYGPDSGGGGQTDSPDSVPVVLERDSDGDGLPDRIDRCAQAAGPSSNFGCAVPPTAPKLTALKLVARKRLVSVTVAADRPAKLVLRVERRKCVRRKCKWALVKRLPARDVSTTRSTFKLTGRFAKGAYRAIGAVSADGVDGTLKTVKLTVR
jgi:subtilisin family serine protease